MREDPGSSAQAEIRRLAAIMFTDIVGFSCQMGADETRMLRLLAVHNQIIEQYNMGGEDCREPRLSFIRKRMGPYRCWSGSMVSLPKPE